MGNYQKDWEDLGRNIQDIVDRAINSQDYQRLNQTIRQTVEKALDVGSEAVRKAVDSASRPTPQKPQYTESRQTVVMQRSLPALYGNTGGKMAVGVLKTVGGGLLCFLSLMGMLALGIIGLVTDAAVGFGLGSLALATAGGGWLLSRGVGTLNFLSRFKKYQKTLGQKTYCTLEKLARSVGKSVKFVRKELQQMINKGLFLEGHLDKEGVNLITSDETYRYYEQSRLQLEQRKQQQAAAIEAKKNSPYTPQVQEVLDKGNAFLAQIRKCNDDIPGEEISRKISHMENIVRRIFERVKEHPEIVPDLKKLMDYYLPMTVKLLNAYADMDAQPVQGQTIQNSKKEIEDTLDTLNQAFEKLLDELFMDTAMDVSSDISVLQTLLAQEGLTEDELTRAKKQKML